MMHMKEAWMYTYDSQVNGWMKRWKGEGKFWGTIEGTPKIPTIQHFKRIKAATIEVMDQAITKVATIEE